MFKFYINLLLEVLVNTAIIRTAFSQDGQQSTPKPCATPEARQFDFWLGDWELTWPAEQWGGNQGEKGQGTNHIIKQLDDCVIQENFSFPSGNFNGSSGFAPSLV